MADPAFVAAAITRVGALLPEWCTVQVAVVPPHMRVWISFSVAKCTQVDMDVVRAEITALLLVEPVDQGLVQDGQLRRLEWEVQR